MATGGGFSMEYIGWRNYYELLNIDPNFKTQLFTAVTDVIIKTPSILIFSFMMAAVLNQQFRGRTVFRVIFFLPVVLTSGVMFTMSSIGTDNTLGDTLTTSMLHTINKTGDVNMINSITTVVQQMNISPQFTQFVIDAANKIYEIVNSSGVQILIFLAGLQTVSPSLFESSNIEGATAWENFWKITFPMVSPMILVSLIYTIVDAMNSVSTRTVTGALNNDILYSVGAARSWMYFICIFVILAISLGIVSKFVYYENE